MRKYARVWIEKYPSIAKINKAITGPRRMGSEGTVENYVKGVRRFVIMFLGFKDPEVVLKKMKKGEINAAKKVDGYVDWALERWAHGTVRSHLFGIKKWFALNGIKVDWDRIEFPTSAEIQEIDRAPTREELKLLLNHASGARDRALIYCLTSNGLRLGTFLSLKKGDVDFKYPDVALMKVERKPGRKFVTRKGRSRGRFYATYITLEARNALIQYFSERKKAGEKLTDESPLIGDAFHKGNFITVEDYEKVWARLLKRAGLDEKSVKWYVLHIHTLRKYFRSNCVGVDVSYREFWMGHKGGYLDESYFRAEEEKHLIEYQKAIPHLTVYSTGLEEKQLRVKTMLDFARLQGYEDEKLKRLEEVLVRAKDIDEGIREFKRFQEKQGSKTMHNGNGKYAVVQGENELLRKLENGWKLVQSLNHDKYLLQQN